MSKVLVYVMDKIVWMLLITALTTQALQIAGVINAPKGLQEITYTQDNEYNYQLAVEEADTRGKRETQERSQIIDSLFNIPIQTLNAVNNLVQNSRPALRGIRDYAVRRFTKSGRSTTVGTTTTTTTEQPESNVYKRSYPVYIRPKEDEDKYKL
ncbi:uncharacterized protein LOC108903651 isoform X2 [Anoplophora glabripennis]|uniref:uncharacterized protein LOC108903651 isoform X2 n=1 Tax=Anoplophora glabripennis TaxID=217634 RepID=UPI000874ECC2|nr:uncharacterized protein LOC108903651 isoform X2 [Anoplophora glabripennis]